MLENFHYFHSNRRKTFILLIIVRYYQHFWRIDDWLPFLIFFTRFQNKALVRTGNTTFTSNRKRKYKSRSFSQLASSTEAAEKAEDPNVRQSLLSCASREKGQCATHNRERNDQRPFEIKEPFSSSDGKGSQAGGGGAENVFLLWFLLSQWWWWLWWRSNR